jgi:hypothetical protein
MKKIWMGLFAVFIGLYVSAQKLSIKNLMGRWETADGAGLEIIDSSRIFVTYGNERKQILTYDADFSKSPYWFDFVVKDSAQQLSTMKSLLLLQGNDVLKWQVFEDGNRPSDFISDRGNLVILRRRK